MKRLYTSKRNPCPICANHHGCAIREDDLIECLRSTSQHDAPQGYRFIKLLRNGMGGLFGLASDQRSEPHQNQIDRQQQKKKAAADRARGALPVAELDRAIRKLHKHFGLGSQHKQNLRDRHLTDAQIDAGLFFSVWPDQELPPGIPANLPGVTRRGDKFYAAGSGYTCPSFDPEGRVNGWQIRYDDPEKAGGKYKWPVSPHLPNGELPITVARPLGGVIRPGVRLVEGFLKPYIAAQKLGQICIGSPNGQFANSPEQTLAALEAYSVDRRVILVPDGGDVRNPQVMQRWAGQIKWLQEQGYTVSVEWWGQRDKSHLDVDELNGTEAIAHIAPEEFLALGGQGTPSQTAPTDRLIGQVEWELKHGFGKRLRERIKQTLEGFKGFGTPPAPEPPPKEAPDRTFQEAKQRLSTWQDAVKQGHKYILDASPPGLGKSHAAGIAVPEGFEVERLWYLLKDHRNPTTGVVESNYVDLPARHSGLVIDDSRKTPNGTPFLRHPKPGEEPDTKGNCPKTDLFRQFRAKNLNVEASESSPICQTCKLAHLCKSGSGEKYGATFRGARKDALGADRIRAHPDSMPQVFDYKASGVVWDEVGTQLKTMDSVTVTLADFDQVWAELEGKAPDLHQTLKLLRLASRPLLTGELKQPYHGWGDAAIRAMLPEKPDNLTEIIGELETILRPDLEFLKEQPDSVSVGQGVSKAQQKAANSYFKKKAHQEFSEGFQKLALNWLVPFLKVWNGERGAFRCERKELTIFTRSDRHAAIAKAAKFNIFLDATIDREQLALLLDVDPSEIYVVGQETPNHENLKILQITGLGKLGKGRSELKKQQVAALRKGLRERYPGVIFADWKCHAEEGDGQWFVNLRGSNEFQTAPTMAVFGVPYQNVGVLQAQYQTLTGDYAPLDKENPHEGLQQFVEKHTQAEIEQAVGRLRSHLRPDEELTFVFIGDYDLSFLGMPIEKIAAFQIAPEAGTPAQINRWKFIEAACTLTSQGKKLTEDAIAVLIGKCQATVHNIADQLGGWKPLRKLLVLLLDPLYSDSNNFETLTDEEKSLIDEYLAPVIDALVPAISDQQSPEGVEQCLDALTATVLHCIDLLGYPKLLEGVRCMPVSTQANLLSVFLRGVP